MDIHKGIIGAVIIISLLSSGVVMAKAQQIGPFNESTSLIRVHRVAGDVYCLHLEPGECITSMSKKFWDWWTMPEFISLLNKSYNASFEEFKLNWKNKKNVSGIRYDYVCDACRLNITGASA